MLDACRGIDSVFHTAATIPLMGGRAATRKYREDAYATNVAGTKHTLSASQKQGVARLVYTSSVDVCFDGSPMPDMHEALPYARRVKSVYAATKIAAEKMVLEASGRGAPFTCAIRADGIYGAGSNEILDRFVAAVGSGRMRAAIGDASTLQDNSHVDNLVHGEILAARHLVPGGAACGKAFFITDDSPMNAFEFFRPLIEGLGYEFPKWRIPRAVLLPILTIWQFLHFRLGIEAPMMTPHELDKVSVTHFASIERAHQELGYQPIKTVAEAMAECLPYCRDLLERGDRRPRDRQPGAA
jgi:3beta-hydroxy-delta5-steroid dehydrogenase/steroid delta-isomerase